MECWFEILYKNIIYVIGNFSTSIGIYNEDEQPQQQQQHHKGFEKLFLNVVIKLQLWVFFRLIPISSKNQNFWNNKSTSEK